MTISKTPTDASQKAPPKKSWWRSLISQRSVQLFIAAWILVNVLIVLIAHGHLPFDRPLLQHLSYSDKIVTANQGMLEVFVLMIIVQLLTRRRTPDVAAQVPDRSRARREVAGALAYAVVGEVVGMLLGRALGWHAFGFHVMGTLFGTHQMVTRPEVFCWLIYNFVLFAVVPYFYFRKRGYTNKQLLLRSTNRKNDALVIFVVLAIEATLQLAFVSSAIFKLSPHQILLGAPLTFVLYFFGTVLPTMIFVYAILLPRYLKLTGSTATAVILGGLTYMLMHFFDGWTNFHSLSDTILSIMFLLLLYVGPGMFKAFVTLRTGNAWVHVWSYHAIAPHTLIDTPHMVEIFQIK